MREIVVVGTSLGGLAALRVFLEGLPRNFPVPVVIVQHRGKDKGESLTTLLQFASALPVQEVEDKQAIAPKNIYLAPADYHLLIERGIFALSTEAPVAFSRPSIDLLFESAADAYGAGVVCVVLTGANADGAQGAAAVKRRGGLVVVEDPATAEARAMPDAAIAVGCDHILPLPEIPVFLVDLFSRPQEMAPCKPSRE